MTQGWQYVIIIVSAGGGGDAGRVLFPRPHLQNPHSRPMRYPFPAGARRHDAAYVLSPCSRLGGRPRNADRSRPATATPAGSGRDPLRRRRCLLSLPAVDASASRHGASRSRRRRRPRPAPGFSAPGDDLIRFRGGLLSPSKAAAPPSPAASAVFRGGFPRFPQRPLRLPRSRSPASGSRAIRL